MYVIVAAQWFHSSAFATGEWTYGSPRLERYNGVSSVNIQGTPAPGVSSGDAMLAMEEIIGKLPSMGLQGFDYEWTGLSLEERDSGNQTAPLLVLSMLIVFLCLAALYESWSIPVSVFASCTTRYSWCICIDMVRYDH